VDARDSCHRWLVDVRVFWSYLGVKGAFNSADRRSLFIFSWGGLSVRRGRTCSDARRIWRDEDLIDLVV